ncbi:MAG TPA: SdrD B-like domain-containing protein, partial [Dermatophilaceae bacterium]|nr:SdrD B-like domain-containing protein [Dermatophilaceae bacterium]
MHRAPLDRAARVRRFAAGVVITAMAMLGLHAAPVLAAGSCGDGVVTCGVVSKEVVNPKPIYQVGDTVTYRLTFQCSSLEQNCGIGTAVDVLDPNLSVTSGAVVLPNPLPFPMTYAWGGTGGNTLTLTLGNATTPWPDGSTFSVYVTATVKSYPLTAPVGVINNQTTLSVTRGSAISSAIVPINVAQPVKDFGLRKSSVSSIAPGENATFQISFTRPTRVGGVDVTSAVVTDPLPADLQYVSSTAAYAAPGWTTSYDPATHTVTWNLGAIPAGSSMNCDAQGLNCYAYTVLYVTVKVPPNSITGTMPPAGTVYTNTASAVLTYKDGATADVSATGTVTTATPVVKSAVAKYGPAKVAPGGQIVWRVTSMNNGNVSLANATLTDKLPTTTLTNIELFRQYTGYQPMNPATGTVTIEFSPDGTTWGSAVIVNAALTTPTVFPVPAGSTYWRMTTANLLPGQSLDMALRATVPLDTSLDATVVNCASMTSSTTSFTAPTDSCVTTTVDPPEVVLTPIKGLQITGPNAPTSVTPLEVFDWVIGFVARSSVPLTSATVSDVIPPQFEVIGVTCFTSLGTGSGDGTAVLGGSCPKYPVPAYTTEVLADGSGTLVLFKDMPLPPVTYPDQNFLGYGLHIQVRVKPGTSVADYTNTVKVSTNDQVTACYLDYGVIQTTDTTDIDQDGNTTETICTNKAIVKVIEAETVQVRKWDIGDTTLGNIFQETGTTTPPAGSLETVCPDWDGYTRYPCVAQTLPGGSFSYRIEMTNVGNVPMTDYVLYDVLPVIGDTGVGQLLSGGQRGTEWSPVLTGPVVLDAALSTSTNSGYLVEYNLTSNPCRPELNQDAATPDATWQTTCSDVWYTEGQITDWSTVKSFRITLFQPVDGVYPTWLAGQGLVFVVPMKAPLNAPQSTFEPLDLSTAWNSVAYRGFRVMAGADPKWLPPAEPRKVGIVVPFTVPPAVSVGDYFWYDTNDNGLQDDGEAPVVKATVQLLDVDRNVLGTTTTNTNGYYSFVNLVPDTNYIIKFVNPDPAYQFTLQNVGGVTDNSRTDDLTDSDADPVTGEIAFNSGPVGNNDPGGPTEADAGTDNPGLDAGLVKKPTGVSIGDYVWYDNNRDGLQT